MKDKRILHIDSELGKIVVNECIYRGLEINTQKLEKLLVLMHGKMLAEYDKSFLRTEIIATKSAGIMVPKVDKDFIMYGLTFTEPLEEYVLMLEAQQKVMNSVLKTYGEYDAFDLQEKTKLGKINDICLKNGIKFVPKDLIKKAFSSIIEDWDNLDFDLQP